LLTERPLLASQALLSKQSMKKLSHSYCNDTQPTAHFTTQILFPQVTAVTLAGLVMSSYITIHPALPHFHVVIPLATHIVHVFVHESITATYQLIASDVDVLRCHPVLSKYSKSHTIVHTGSI
jgi:hypothetical protein